MANFVSGSVRTDPLKNTLTKDAKTPPLGQYFGKKTFNFAVQGAYDLFKVTGLVLLKIVAVCKVDMAGATATIEVGITGNTAGIIAQTTATDLDVNEIWHDATPDSTLEADSVMPSLLVNGSDVILTVGTADLTGGQIDFYAYGEPIDPDASVVAA